MSEDTLLRVAIWLVPLVVAIVFHEVAHGYVARRLGDHTAEEQGRLTLNPLRHIDPVGTVILPLILMLAKAPIFGWAKPVPVRFDRLRNPRRDMMLVALAGPATNFLLALAGAALLALCLAMGWGSGQSGAGDFLARMALAFILINCFLGVFNLLPVPPFDGGHVVQGLLPSPLAERYGRLQPYAMGILFFLLLILPMLIPGANVVARVVSPIVEWLAGHFLALAQLFAGR